MVMQSLDDIRAFLPTICGLSRESASEAIKQEIERTGGCFMEPDPAAHRQTTHLFEISLFEVVGRGLSAKEAVGSWIGAAGACAGVNR